jgi:hypothetical protein
VLFLFCCCCIYLYVFYLYDLFHILLLPLQISGSMECMLMCMHACMHVYVRKYEFLQSLHILHDLKSSFTTCNFSFLTYGNIVTSISSCFASLPHLNNWHSLPLHIHCNLPISLCPTVLLQYAVVLVQCYILIYKSSFGNLLNVVNVIKFRCTLNFLVLTTPTVMDKV